MKDNFDIVKIFEERNNVGGVWDYRSDGVLYKSLVTNLPKTVMQYSSSDPFISNESNRNSKYITHKIYKLFSISIS